MSGDELRDKKTLADLPIDRPVATLMVLVSLFVLGAVAIFRLPLDFMPTVVPPFVMVEVPFPGAHPLEGLRDVVRPIEEEVATISGIESLRSHAETGGVSVHAEFDWSVNVDLKKMEIREALDRARPNLPDELGHVQVRSFNSGPGDGAILQGRISARRDLSESWDLLDRRIKRPLERIKGVARVDLGGVEPQQVRVEVDPEALKRHNVLPQELVATLQAANLDLDLGALHGDLLKYNVRAVGRFRGLDEIRSLTVRHGGVRVRDVASVEFKEPVLPYGRHLDREFAISIEVFKEPSANTVATVDALMERIREIESDPQLEGIQLLIWNNSGEEIRRSLGGLRNAGIFGGLLAIGVLYLFLRRLRTTLIVAVAIPFSLVVTCGAMYLLGSQFNVLTLLGLMLGVGMLVDNAVVVIENIYRLQGTGMPAKRAARVGVRQVALAVLASTATTVIVWSWLFVAERNHLTIYMGAVAMTICLAVVCSLLISLTFIPLAAARFLSGREVRPGFLLRRLVPAYRGLLGWTLRHRFVSLVALLALAGSAAYPIMKIEKSGDPSFQEKFVAIRYEVYDQSTKEVLEGYVDTVEEWLWQRKAELGFRSVYSYWNENGFVVTWVYPPFEETSPEGIAALRRRLDGDLPEIPGVKIEIGEREWWRHGSQGRRLVSVALHGEDPEYLSEVALDVERRLKGVEDLQEVFGPTLRGQQEARILIDPDKARALGVEPQAVAETVSLTFRGRNLRRFWADSGEMEMLLSLPDELQPGLAALADLPIPRGDELDTVPLGSVAEVAIARTDPRIDRRDRQTTTWVNAEFPEEITTQVARERVRERLAGLELPEGYSWDFGEWGRDHDEGLATMQTGVAVSLLVVLLLMAALFESFTQPLAILITLPLAFFGGFWVLWLFGYKLDAIAFMGVIVLIGIVVNNGIVMVDHVNSLRRAGKPRVEALVEGCGDRLRPVLMTAITTLFGLVPLALSSYTVAGAYIDSLAVVVIGGLTTSTLFTLVAMPVWYVTLEDLGSVVARALPRVVRRGPAAPPRGVL
ncbi:MAG: efflux RND transporter permease subunit, partial [Thermoanaerobaculia bacterium]|nr:efflux RND transporter permease subunit [Thermoanaerobaculia bacterium]